MISNKMKEIINLLILLCLSNPLMGETIVEAWECAEINDGLLLPNWNNILVKATVLEGRENGKIEVAGIIQEAAFAVAGFNRRWDFGLSPNGTYGYAFVMEPNGFASYIAFGKEESAKPSMFMSCRQEQ